MPKVCECEDCEGREVSARVFKQHEQKRLRAQSTRAAASSRTHPVETHAVGPQISGTSWLDQDTSSLSAQASTSTPTGLPSPMHIVAPTLPQPVAQDSTPPSFPLDIIPEGSILPATPIPTSNDPPPHNHTAAVPSHEGLNQPTDAPLNARSPTPQAQPSDSSDPFRYKPANHSATALPTPGEVHNHPVVYFIYLLVFWLHAQCHLPFRACNAVLGCFTIILRLLHVDLEPPLFVTLASAMSALNADPIFKICPVCPTCLKVYPPDSSFDASCCSKPLFNTVPTAAQQRRGTTTRDKPKPNLQFPYKSIEEQLAQVLSVPAIEEEMEKFQEQAASQIPLPFSGTYSSILDGQICRTLPTKAGGLFFSPTEAEQASGELRIGLALGVDWFSYLRSQIAPSHTSCPMSFSIINLPPHLRYRTANLLLFGIMPGPKEADFDQVHHFMHLAVNELIRLWEDGTVIITRKFPNGRLVRVILVVVVCDKPAAHKMGGFGSHSHTYFCTKCWIQQDKKAHAAAFQKNGFRARTNEEHRSAQEGYRACTTKTARAEFAKDHATRWSELSRLPYFDMCRMIVVDPMHNLFLGVVKTHFYHIWVQQNVLRKTKELRKLHSILAEIPMPAKLGRLPSLIGEPAGGSLTADQWLVFATVVAPLAIPQLWSEYMSPEASSDPNFIGERTRRMAALQKEKQAAAAAARKTQEDGQAHQSARPQRQRRPTARAQEMDVDPDDGEDDLVDDGAIEDSEDDESFVPGTSHTRKRPRRGKANEITPEDEARDAATPSNLHPKDPQNFLKLCMALQILVSRTITEHDLQQAEVLLSQYCMELVELYGPAVIRPNHHYCTHTGDGVRDYGPLHEFWTFLFERLNKVLKAYKTNNHGKGEIEVSFFREFHRTVQETRLLAEASRSPDPNLQALAAQMYRATADDRGTVQALAQDLDEAQPEGGISFRLSDRCANERIPTDMYYKLLSFLSARHEPQSFHSFISLAPTPRSQLLPSIATFFDYVVVDQNQYSSFNRLRTAPDSIVAIRFRFEDSLSFWVGDLLDIFSVAVGTTTYRYAHLRWYIPLDVNPNPATPRFWDYFAPANVQLWHANRFLQDGDPGPPKFIPLQDIACYAIRTSFVQDGQTNWATVLRKRVRLSISEALI